MVPSRRLAGIFLLSFATLLLELALTRVLSVAQWYHFGFLVISTALLGFGAAGVALALWPYLRERAPLDVTLSRISLLCAVVILVSFWLMQRIPFDPFALAVDPRQLLLMPVYYLVLAAPFFCSGLGIGLLLTRSTGDVNRLYAFDLMGAGVGCAALAFVMPRVGGSGSIVVAAAVACLAAVAFAGFTSRLAVAGALGAIAGLALAPGADRALPISIAASKGRSRHPPIYTAWNTFSRIDVYEDSNGTLAASPTSRTLVFDQGTAATSLNDMRPSVRAHLNGPPDSTDFDSGVAYVGMHAPRVLIIGSGAGPEVFDGLYYGASSITAVEVNPIIVDVVTHRMRDYWGDLFTQPGVRLVTDEGRSFIRRSHERYDIIISVHTISNAAVASGALGLAENYVLTEEAFDDYLDRLTPDGTIFFTRPEAQIPRLFATARAAFARHGWGSPAAHLVAFRQTDTSLARAGRPSFVGGFLLKKSPYTAAEVAEIARRLHAAPGGTTSSHIELTYTPFGVGRGTLLDSVLTAPDVRALYRASAIELTPATDDRPFFNQHVPWSRIGLSAVRDVLSQKRMGRIALEDRPVAEVTLLLLLVQSVVVAAALILLPLAWLERRGLRVTGWWRYLLYFAALGIGFMFVEMALIQRFTLFLGEPVYALAAVLAGLLIFTGVGSALGARLPITSPGAVARMLLALIVVLTATAIIAPVVCSAALALPLDARVTIAVLLVAPLGVTLGLPFPTGLRIASANVASIVPWAWGVNGFFTVIGSVAAVILGMAFGFTAVLALAGLCYAVAIFALEKIPQR